MDKDYRQLKLWQGILILASAALIIFVISPRFLSSFGLYGTLLAELLMLAAALVLVTLFKGNPKEVFPVKKPAGVGIFGTVLMWVGTLLAEMTLTLILAIFFPQQIMGVSAGLSMQMTDVPFLVAVLIIAVTPAVCEEAVFRGAFLSSLNPGRHKWGAILITGVIFGMFHGSIFRFLPTAIGGIVMAYILVESGNMFYNSFFHFVNNLLPTVLLFGMQGIYDKIGLWDMQGSQSMLAAQGSSMFMVSAGMYMMICAAAPSCFYIGNYLLHSHTPGYKDRLFPSGKAGTVIALIVASALLFFAGIVLMAFGIIKTGLSLQ